MGLQQKLPDSYPLLKMYRDLLMMSHKDQENAVNNYIGTISRCLRYVYDKLTVEGDGIAPGHWSQLLQYT